MDQQTSWIPGAGDAPRARRARRTKRLAHVLVTYEIGDLVEKAYAYVDRHGTGSNRDQEAARLLGSWLANAKVERFGNA